jgi:hypothetical protein
MGALGVAQTRTVVNPDAIGGISEEAGDTAIVIDNIYDNHDEERVAGDALKPGLGHPVRAFVK